MDLFQALNFAPSGWVGLDQPAENFKSIFKVWTQLTRMGDTFKKDVLYGWANEQSKLIKNN